MLDAQQSTWREAIDAFAAAEPKTRGRPPGRDGLETLSYRFPLIQRIPADATILKVTFDETSFRSFSTLIGDGLQLAEWAGEVSANPDTQSAEVVKALAHAKSFVFSCLDKSCLLFGHSLGGPLTILDGTHRALAGYIAAYISKTATFSPFDGYVALSESACYSHGPDRASYVARDDAENLRRICARYYAGT